MKSAETKPRIYSNLIFQFREETTHYLINSVKVIGYPFEENICLYFTLDIKINSGLIKGPNINNKTMNTLKENIKFLENSFMLVL